MQSGGACFILGFMEGEAIREMANGSRVVEDYEIHWNLSQFHRLL
jgi:hypothetical protein